MFNIPRTLKLTAILGGISMLVPGCSAQPANADSVEAKTTADTKSETVTLKFRKGQVLSFVAPEARADGDAARQDYYKNIFPIAEPLGFKRETALAVTEKIITDYDPGGFILYSWPDAKAQAAFENDPKWPALRATRPDAWSELKIYSDELDEDLTLSFDPDKTYTVVVAWLKPGGITDYRRYLDGIDAAVNAAGGRFIYKMTDPVFESHASAPQAPQQLTFVEWDRIEGFSEVRASDAYKEYSKYFASGVDRVEFYRLALPSKK